MLLLPVRIRGKGMAPRAMGQDSKRQQFDLSASMRLEQTEVYRVPGVKGIQRNDVLVLDALCPEKIYFKCH